MGRYRAGSRRRSREADVAAFWAKVDRSGQSACWPWTGLRDTFGHGRAWFDGRAQKAHRVAWQLAGNEILATEVLRHLVCDNPPCVNPAHLAVGSHADNMADMAAHGRASRHGGTARGDRHGSRTRPDSVPRGTRQGRAKLTDEAVREIRRLYAAGEGTTYSLAEGYGVSQSTVAQIIRGTKWAHVS